MENEGAVVLYLERLRKIVIHSTGSVVLKRFANLFPKGRRGSFRGGVKLDVRQMDHLVFHAIDCFAGPQLELIHRGISGHLLFYIG